MGIFDFDRPIIPNIGPITGGMPQLPQQGGGFLSGIGDWLGGEMPGSAGTNRLGYIGAALQDAGAAPGDGGYLDRYTRRSQNAQTLAQQQKVNKDIQSAFATGDMNKVRQVLMAAAANGTDISHITQALQFGQPKYEQVDPAKDTVSIDPLTGERKMVSRGVRPMKAPTTRTVRMGGQEVTQEFDEKTGQWKEVGRGAAWKPDDGTGLGNSGVVVPPGGQLIDRRTGKPLYTAPPKKLPASVQAAESDDISAIQTSRSISKDLGVVRKQIQDGQLTLSPFANAAGSAMNYLGVGNDNSHRMATFKSSLEKLRNDSLRLNKGVQTEGDAVRAWNELFSNLNDQNLVQQRLAEIQAINDRAANLHAQQIDLRRRNYDYPDFDPNQIAPEAALGGPGSTGAPGSGGGQQAPRQQQTSAKIRVYNPATGRLE